MSQSKTLSQTSKYKFEIENAGPKTNFRFEGIIDERVDFTPILTEAQKHPDHSNHVFLFDIGQITRINSCGIREWLMMIDRISTTVQCEFKNVNELFIEQLNMIPAMFGKKKPIIHSFQAPYHCAGCNLDTSCLLTPKQIRIENGVPRAPSIQCEKCSKSLEFDWLEEEYFAFVKRL